MRKFIPNSGQEAAIRKISSWYLSRKPFLILEGAAGTGKTAILKEAIPKLFRCFPLYTAPTNEAVRQLELSLGDLAIADGPNKNLLTTYSLLGYTMDSSTEKQEFVKRKNSELLLQANLIIVDEASMVSKELLAELIALGSSKKILFVGHSRQLPPVVGKTAVIKDIDANSPVFEQEFWEKVCLDKSERAANPELASYVKHLEGLIDSEHKLYKMGGRRKSKEDLLDYIHSVPGRRMFKTEQAKVISFSNREVDGWNRLIRESLHRERDLPLFLPEDRILITKPVVSVGEIDRFSEKVAKKYLRPDKFSTLPTNSRFRVRSVDEVKVFEIPSWKLTTWEEDVLFVAKKAEDLDWLRKKLFAEASIGAANTRHLRFTVAHNLLNMFAQVKHSYAFTTHRSQGMTIPEVWVNWADIQVCGNTRLKHKLLYVAASRARDNLFIVE